MSNYRRTFLQRAVLLGSGLTGATTGTTAARGGRSGSSSVRLEGAVRHFGAPVEDATVTVGDRDPISTDEMGAYGLALEPGAYTLTVAAPGYATVTDEVTVPAGETVASDFDLEREWGPGVGGVEVSATPVGGGKTIPCEITIFGDERYSVTAPLGAIPDGGENWTMGFEVTEGWWEILVTDADGYSDGHTEVFVEDGEAAFGWVQLPEGDQQIPTTGTIDGTVVDERGDPVATAAILTDGAWIPVDDDGSFELEREHGRHRIAATAPGSERVADDVLVKFGRTTELTVRLRSRQSPNRPESTIEGASGRRLRLSSAKTQGWA